MITITAISAAITLPTFGEKPVLDFGNTSDIVSAFCNIAMASAAVFAGSKAVSFFKQKAYDHALEIVKEIKKIKTSINQFNINLLIKTSLKVGIYTPANFPPEYKNTNTPNNFDTTESEIQELNYKCELLSTEITNLIVSLRSTKPFGYTMKDQYLEPLCNALSGYINISRTHISFYKQDVCIISSALTPNMPFKSNDQNESLNDAYNTINHISSKICNSSLDENFNF
ncbi:hypothetical protein ACAY19_003610 [Serratia liquefaciens]|nr:hypothetical protein [Serratia liquefaciens]